MRVAVITPYFKESRPWLERCIASVQDQSVACDHILVADGHPQAWIDETGVRHLRLDRSHADFGNTPRSIGAQLAISEGYDAISFLDADNWYEPEHVQTCTEVARRTGADFVSAQRYWVRADGSRMPVRTSEDDDGRHVDTSCLFLLYGAFHSVTRWLLMPKPMGVWGDRFYLASLRQEGLSEARTSVRTVNYLCTWASVFQGIGEAVPSYAKDGVSSTERLKCWLQRLQPADLPLVQRLTGCDLVHYFESNRAA